MNVSQLQPPVSHLNRLSKEAQEKDAKFLSFKQLNKRTRVRLSQKPFPEQVQPKAHLFAVANLAGWFAAVTRCSDTEIALIFSPLSFLRIAFFTTGQGDEVPFEPQRILPIPQMPAIIAFASNDTRMLLGLTSGQIVLYDTSALFVPGLDDVHPIHSWPSIGPNSLRQILPNPGEMQDQVAILRRPDAPKAVEILDVQKLESIGGWSGSSTASSIPMSVSWSPKGKQLAIGLQSGDILTFVPAVTSAPKQHIPVPSFSTPHALLSITWLATPTFYAVYTPSFQDGDQLHVVITVDSKAGSAEDIKLAPPNYLTAGATPSTFPILMKSWDPAKVILIVGDSASSDIGVIGNFGDEWCNFYLEETGTPRLPLDNDGNETVLMALELDLTNDHHFHGNIDGEDISLPPPPIIYAYTSDGTLQAWSIVNTSGEKYTGVVVPKIRDPTESAFSSNTMASGPFAQSSPFGSHTRFGENSPFSQSTAFGQQPQSTPFGGHSGKPTSSFVTQTPLTFGGSFGQQTGPSAFGQPSFGQPSVFRKSGAFGGGSTSTPPTGTDNFGSYSSKFLQPTKDGPEVSQSLPPAEEMSMDASFSSLSNLSMDDATSDRTPAQSEPLSLTSPFSQSQDQPADQVSTSTSAFNWAASSVVKPAIGFGTFGQPREGENTAPTSVFRQSAFGTNPGSGGVFGQSGFGTSAFGKTGSTNSSVPATGGFAAFAKTRFASFSGEGATLVGKPVSDNRGGEGSVSAFGGTSVFGSQGAIAVKSSTLPNISGSHQSPDSPPPSPIDRKMNNNSMAASTPQTSAPPPTQGFAQFQTSNSTFLKPASGFGAFGSGSQPSSSPFLNPKPVSESTSAFKASTSTTTFGAPSELGKSGSVFGAPSELGKSGSVFGAPSELGKSGSVFGTPSQLGKGGSVFGAPSVLGSAKSVFGTATPSTLAESQTTSPTTVGFGAYGGTSSGFGAFASQRKSFAELLKEGDSPQQEEQNPLIAPKSSENAKPSDPIIRDSSVGVVTNEETGKGAGTPPLSAPSKGDADLPKSVQPAFGTPAKEEAAVPPVSSVEESSAAESSTATPPTPKGSKVLGDTQSPPRSEAEKDGDGNDEGPLDSTPTPKISQVALPDPDNISLGVISLSSESTTFETISEGDVDADADGVGVDDMQSFLSESSSEGSESVPDDEESSGEERESSHTPSLDQARTVSLTPVPSPTSKSSSTTPTQDTPVAQVITSSTPPVPDKPLPSKPTVSPAASSATPAPPTKEPPPTPPPVPVVPTATPLMLGRRTTRPARSSPLASTSVTEGDDDQADKPTALSQPITPKSVGNEMPRGSESKVSRPKTPPLLDKFATSANVGAPSPTSSPTPLPKSAGLVTATAISPTFFSATTKISPRAQPTLTPVNLPDGKISPTPPLPPPAATSPLFGTKKADSPSLPVKPQSNTNLSGLKNRPYTPTSPSPLGQSSGKAAPPANAHPSVSAPPSNKPVGPSLSPAQQGMQTECAHLFSTLARELEGLKILAQETNRRRTELNKSPRGSRRTADLGDRSKWALSDVAQFGRVLKQLESDIAQLKSQREEQSQSLRELRGHMLKAQTRKEEIMRFKAVKTDAEFTEILRMRTLCPEHLEKQSQLRRNVAAVRDRVQKLEDHLHGSKKKLREMKTATPSLKAPSLDTINRTYRNIDTALDQQARDVVDLTSRMAKLDFNLAMNVVPTRDKRLPEIRPQPNITPHVASTTAAALNAERSAQKLKRALIARKEPLLNTKATCREGANAMKQELAKVAPLVDASGPETIDWSIPKFDASRSPSPSGSLLTRRTGGVGFKHHSKPISLKKGGASGPSSTQKTSFDWGPLPSITPMTSISIDVRKKQEKSEA